MAQRKFIQATEGQLGQAPVVRNIEVCSDCGENAPKLGDNPERMLRDAVSILDDTGSKYTVLDVDPITYEV